MIPKSTTPWGNFLHARRIALEWLRNEGKNDEEIAEIMCMDKIQVTLILMTSVERDE